jgi:hypothetical protein
MQGDESSNTSSEPRPHGIIATTFAFWVVSFVLLVVFSRNALRQEFFFDEAWRADVIRSSNPLDRLKAFKTPLPPLWPMLLHFTGLVVRGRFTTLRLQATALAAFLPAVLGQLSRLAIANLWAPVQQRRADAAGLVATVGCCGFVGSMGLGAYLNDYVFQAALTSAMVLAWLGIDRGWWKPIWSVPIMLAMAVGTISGLFILPAFGVWLWRKRQQRELRSTMVGFVASGVLAATTYLAIYRHQTEPSLERYWGDSLFRHGNRSLLQTIRTLVVTVGRMLLPLQYSETASLIIGVVLLVAAVVGLRALHRWWPPIAWTTLSTWIIAIVASITVSWPATAVRVNLPFVWLWFLVSIIGIGVAVRRIAPRIGQPAVAIAATVISLVVLTVAYKPGTGAFARGLNRDLDPIRNSSASRIAVVGYHFMSAPYLHDGLVNNAADRARYQFIQENYEETTVYDTLPSMIAALNLPAGAEVWCIVPYDIGPEASIKACLLDPTKFTIFFSEREARAVLIGATVNG